MLFLCDNRGEIIPTERKTCGSFDESMVWFEAHKELFSTAIPMKVWENKSAKAPLNEDLKTVIRALSVAAPVSRHTSAALPVATLQHILWPN